MARLRFAILAGAAGIGFVCGCTSLSFHPLFGRRSTCSGPDCCTGPMVADQEGPVIEGSGVPVMPVPSSPGGYPPVPGGPGGYAPPPILPQNQVPQLSPTPTPRLIPQPQQSPTMPYTPP